MKSFRLFSRSLRPSSLRSVTRTTLISTTRIGVPVTQRHLSTTQYRSRGLSPDSTDPKPPNPESSPSLAAEPASLSDSEYHEIADQYLNNLVLALEEKAESSEGLEVEYSVRRRFLGNMLPFH
jgi:frataxin